MQRRELGSSGLHVSQITLGTNAFGWSADETQAFAVLDAFVAVGGNLIDTADVYTNWAPGNQGGESENIIGRWMKARGNRAEIVIATKLGAPMNPADPADGGLTRERVISRAEDSLRRLQVDTIDLHMAHFDDTATPVEETLRAFDDLVQAGKIRHIGASNYSATRLEESLETSGRLHLAPYVSLQTRYNLLVRGDFEGPLQETCARHNLGVLAYPALASGFLTGKYRQDDGATAGSVRETAVRTRYADDRGWQILAAVRREAERLGASPAAVAVAWLLSRPGVTSALAGARSPEQVSEFAAGADLNLDGEALRNLDFASDA